MMQTEIREGDLAFTFDDAVSVDRFDDERTHGMGHIKSMKRVDFVVAFQHMTWLIEVKDPENRNIPSYRVTAERENFRRKMRSETLYRRELAPKLKDTLIYLALAHRSPTNDIIYVSVLSVTRLDAAMLLTAQNKLKQLCYLPGPFRRPWPSNFDVLVVNMAAWNTKLKPHSIRRP
jgi:hypothetical protein